MNEFSVCCPNSLLCFSTFNECISCKGKNMLIILFRQEVNKTGCHSQESLGQQFEKQSNAMKRAFKRKKIMCKKLNPLPRKTTTTSPKLSTKKTQHENKQKPHTKINIHTNNKPNHFYYNQSQVKARFQCDHILWQLHSEHLFQNWTSYLLPLLYNILRTGVAGSKEKA